MISSRVLRLTKLNKLQQQVLAYIENCGDQCMIPFEHISIVLGCSKTKIQNALDALAAWGFFILDDEIKTKGFRLDNNTEAWRQL